MTAPLEGKKVLITGSSRGIGRATALAMARAGADVAIHYHRQADLANQVAEEIRGLGRDALVIAANLEDLTDVDRMFDHIQEHWNRLDVFMANAAATAFKRLSEVKPYHVERTYRLIVQSLIQSVQRAVPLMGDRGGRIITMSGHGTPYTIPLYATIGSAKGAVETIARYLAYELGPKHITCNTIAPGVVETDSARFYMGERYDEFERAVSRETPLGRLGTPDDVADVAVFLASDAARFITGQVIRVDGGLTITSGPFEVTKRLSDEP
jgi:enoyl-[acyl-carrier protein] reductase III